MPAIRLLPDLSSVTTLNAWFADFVSSAGTPPTVAADMKLCLNEAVANVISYAFDGVDDPVVEVHLSADGPALLAEIRDNGVAFDPLDRPMAAPLTDLATAPIGGFGIKLIRETAHSLAYRRADGFNRLAIACRPDA